MRRKDQETRIEQQRQEKEKAREDAARERARSVIIIITTTATTTRLVTDLKLSLQRCPELPSRLLRCRVDWVCFCSLSRDREERLAALSAAQQEAMEELQKKIQLKVSPSPPLGYSHLTSCLLGLGDY